MAVKDIEEASAELDALQARIEELTTRLSEGIEGERTWTTSELTAFRQELADLQATTREVIPSLTASMSEQREQLTQMRQEMLQLQSTLATISQPPSPGPGKPPAKPADQEAPTKPKPAATGKRFL